MSKKILVDRAALAQLLRAVTGEPHWIRELQATALLDALRPVDTAEAANPINVLIEQLNDPGNEVDVEEREKVLSETYQIVGELLQRTGEFDSDRGTDLLDNLSQMRQVHTGLLPWTYPQHEAELPAALDARLREAAVQNAATPAPQQQTLPGFHMLELSSFPPIQMYRTSDPKYGILNNQLVVAATLQPKTSPGFFFWAEDIHLLSVLDFYLSRVANPTHRVAIGQRFREINEWQRAHTYLLKEPDTVLTP